MNIFSDPKSLIETMSIIFMGIFALVTLFDKAMRGRRTEMTAAEDRVITLLKEEVSGLQNKYSDIVTKFQEQTVKFEKLVTENETLRGVLQGRDQSSLDYQLIGKNTFDTVVICNKNIERLAGLMEKHINQVDQILKKA